MMSQGTGGISNPESYLSERIGLHRNLGMNEFAARAPSILRDLDAGRLADFFGQFHENASFRFGSQDPVVGLQAIKAYVEGFLGTIAAMEHDIHHRMVDQHSIAISGDVRYSLKDGRVVLLPFCDLWRLSAEYKIVDYRIYCDPTPLG